MFAARDNPFEADRIERLLKFEPVWLDSSWDEILARAEAADFRGAVIGPHGSGKTVFCDGLAARLGKRGSRVIRWFLNDTKPTPDPIDLRAIESPEDPGRTMLLIDGAENLGARAWRKLRRDTAGFAGLFVTAHRQKHLPPPQLPVVLRTGTRPEMLIEFARRLAPEFAWDEEELREWFEISRGNLREALWRCYDCLAGRGSVPSS